MSLPIYIDTNVYMDLFGNRSDRLRPLGEFAFEVFKRAIECEFDIIISSTLLDEITYNSYEVRMKTMLLQFESKGKVIHAEASAQDRQNAREISQARGSPIGDTLHAVIAQRMNAAFLVTRNLKDYEELIDLVPVRLPELL